MPTDTSPANATPPSTAYAQAVRERGQAYLGAAFVLGLVGLATYSSNDGYPVLGTAMMFAATLFFAAYRSSLTPPPRPIPLALSFLIGWPYFALMAIDFAVCLLLVAGQLRFLPAMAILAASYITSAVYTKFLARRRTAAAA